MTDSAFVVLWGNKKPSKKIWRLHNYTYDKAGHLSGEEIYKEGSYEERFEYTYNAKNLIEERKSYDYDRKLTSTDHYVFDDKGNLIQHTYHNAEKNKTRVYTYQYTYDTNGNWTNRITYEDKKPLLITGRKITYY